jgi:high-affinity iron transporter
VLAAAIIVFREIIEAGLIIGIVLAVTQGIAGRGRWITAGVAGGVLGAGLVALFAEALSNALAGIGTEVFNAGILAVATCMLAWHNIWMARHGRELATEIGRMGATVASGARSLLALAVVVGVAVLREGSEVVLFLYGLVASEGGSGFDQFAGGMIGLALGAFLSALTYFGLVTIPPRALFGVTSILIAFLAAGMAAQCIFFLAQAGIVTGLSQTLWDSSALLPETSLPGRLLHALFGYSDQPSIMQFLAYSGTLAVIFVLMRVCAVPQQGSKGTISRAASGSS